MSLVASIYKFENVKIFIDGMEFCDHPEDAEVSIEYDRDKVTKQNGVCGGGVFSKRHNSPCSVTIPVMIGSKWINLLNAMKKTDFPVQFTMEDRNSYDNKTLYASGFGQIQDANASYSSEAPIQTFRFEFFDLMEIALP